MTAALPYVRLAWDEVVPDSGEVFIQYNVYRDGVRIAVIPTIATPYYDDYTAIPGVEHEYEVSWFANVSGDVVESDRAEATATLAFRGGWVHDVADPAYHARIWVRGLRSTSEQEIQYRRSRGRRQPTAFVSGLYARHLDVEVIPEAVDEPGMWDALRTLQDRQFTHAAVLCLRLGYRSGERYFVQIDGLEEAHDVALTSPSIRFREVHREEEV